MKTKYSRSQKALSKTIDKYFKDAKEPSYDAEFISISRKGFVDKVYDNPWQVAVHIVISSNNTYGGKEKDLYTMPINEETIYHRLNLKSSKATQQRKHIAKAVNALEEKGIIERCWLNREGKRDKLDNFIAKQKVLNSDGSRSFFTMDVSSFIKIITQSESDNDKINMLATYASLAFSMYRYNKKGTKGQPTTRDLINLMNPINLSTQETLAESIGVNRGTVVTYIDKLCEMNIMAKMKVRKNTMKRIKLSNGTFKNIHSWAYYYSKYNDRAILKRFVSTLLLETQFPDNSEEEYSDLSWVNIDDVWDDEVHKEDN